MGNDSLDFTINTLGPCTIQSPIKLSSVQGDMTANYVSDDSYVINNVNLDYVNMEFKQINITNKLENNIFHSTVVNNGSNVSVPVFYKSVELYETILHPEVTETICINLDYYKSKVNSFLVQIEGIKFKEVGRSSAGVFFKIIGNKLPKKLSSGTLYILNQDSELVTTGKYKYIF